MDDRLPIRTVRVPVPADGLTLVIAIPLDDQDLVGTRGHVQVVARATSLARKALLDMQVQHDLI